MKDRGPEFEWPEDIADLKMAMHKVALLTDWLIGERAITPAEKAVELLYSMSENMQGETNVVQFSKR